MKILLLLAHSIAEYDDLRMLSDLGYDVFSIGAYVDPARPADDKRPPLPAVHGHPELAALVGDQMAAKEHLPEEVIEWADTIICHHYLDKWIVPQWERIKHKRVIWRTCGQSDERLESIMEPLRRDGLEVVRYSPAERRYFEAVGIFAGEDALIRFGKYPDDFAPWSGAGGYVANVTQNMVQRGEWCGLTFYRQATDLLYARPVGPGSDLLPGGLGTISNEAMIEYLRMAGAYIYTGTIPASYTLGLIEAMMAGVPVVSIGSQAWAGPASLFEGDRIAEFATDQPYVASKILGSLLQDPEDAQIHSEIAKAAALDLFDVGRIGIQWRDFLGSPLGADGLRETVGATA